MTDKEFFSHYKDLTLHVRTEADLLKDKKLHRSNDRSQEHYTFGNETTYCLVPSMYLNIRTVKVIKQKIMHDSDSTISSNGWRWHPWMFEEYYKNDSEMEIE